MLSYVIDIARVRQYFNHALRAEMVWNSTKADVRFLDRARRGLFPLPIDRPGPVPDPFPAFQARELPALADQRVAIIATGGSGALASTVGVARVLEEAGITPTGYGVCSGSALFGVPLAAGMSPAEVAAETLAMQPRDYIDPDWSSLAKAPLTMGRGWSGLLRGDALEDFYRRMLGDVTLGELPTPVWMPVVNIEQNRLAYIGPDTHPELSAARAVRLAVGLPVAIQPGELAGNWWLDGGIVEILPSRPFLDEDRCDAAIVVNGFYSPGFHADEEPTWHESRLSILRMASQARVMQHAHIARRSLTDLHEAIPATVELTPVDYEIVQGAGLYAEFLDNQHWAEHMAAGYACAADVLPSWQPEA
jgi:NTE family protein